MAGVYTFPMSMWINFANTVAETSLERIQEITEAIEKRQYKPADLVTDALGFWVDGINGWWSVVQQVAAGPVPFAFIAMRPDEESACREVAARKSGSGTLDWTPLVRLGDGGTSEGPSITARWAENKPACVVVEVHGLNAKQARAKKSMRAGLYQSSIHMDEKLVAIVQVLVEE